MEETLTRVRLRTLGLILLGILVCVLALALLWLVIFGVPAALTNLPDLTTVERLTAAQAVRETLIQLGGGSFLLLGLFFTARTLALGREDHITERYSRSIEQLGHSSMRVRIGGIYALERIARDSGRDRSTVSEVLCALIRDAPKKRGEPRTDVRAAVEVISRLPRGRRQRSLDLRGAHLDGVELAGGSFAGANLSGASMVLANLAGVDLRNAKLIHANLSRANLAGANLTCAHVTPGADLSNAKLMDAHLVDCEMNGAILTGAVLSGADIRRAQFVGAQLQAATFDGPAREAVQALGANFEGADLTNASLKGVDLRDAIGLSSQQREAALDDETTRWPTALG